MATLGQIVVAPEQQCATWTVALADLEGTATDAGLASEEFCLLGHTWSLQMYPSNSSCSVVVQSKEKGPVKGTVTLNGVAQSIDHVFGSTRMILGWPDIRASGSDRAPAALEVTLHISFIGEEATCRAAGEMSLVQQFEALKAERQELQSRVAVLSDELQGVREELAVSEKGRNFAMAVAKKFAAAFSVSSTKVDFIEKVLNQNSTDCSAMQAENERITSERNKLQEDLRDLLDDHELLTQRFQNAQELKAKSEVVAYNAEYERDMLLAEFEAKIKADREEFETTIDAMYSEKIVLKDSLELEMPRLQAQLTGLSSEKERLEAEAKKLQSERDAEAEKAHKADLQKDIQFYRARELDEELKKHKEDFAKKKKSKFFNVKP